MRSALCHYIHNGLARDINEQKMDCYPYMRMVNFTDGVVRVVIGGEDPQSYSTISRDVFIDGFVRVYVRPLVKAKFPDVDRVEYVKTTDEQFEGIVMGLGGKVTTADYWETNHSYHDCMKLFGDNSRLVQGYMKATFPKDSSLPRGSSNLHDTYNTQSFFQKWNIGWYVTDETHVLGTNGVVFWGLDQIKANKEHLPPLLHLHDTSDGTYRWLLLVQSANFFPNQHFKIFDF